MYFVPIMKKVQTGQVIEFYSNSCLVETEFGQVSSMAIKNIVVGDYVELEIIQDSKALKGKILNILERQTKLSKIEGDKSKLFAANISHVGIITTPNPKTSLEFIDKWILKSKLSNIVPFIINNKMDLKSDQEYKDKLDIYRKIDITIINCSAKYGDNINDLIKFLKNKSILFVGNSGAGKSSLSSRLIGKSLKTNNLSNNQGVHTTSLSSLYALEKNTKIIDSPGMRDIHINNYPKEQIIYGFEEILNASKYCKFSDCNHINNEGCFVMKCLDNGQINQSRYNNFIKLRDDEKYK